MLYYLERQLQSPLITLFELIVTDKNGKKFPDTPEGKRAAEREVARRLWKDAKRKKINALNGNQDIRNFFKLKIVVIVNGSKFWSFKASFEKKDLIAVFRNRLKLGYKTS